MTTDIMKIKLMSKFPEKALQQTIWLHTQRTGEMDDLNDQEVEKIYHLFFPMQITAAEIIVKQQEQSHLKTLRAIVLTDAQYTGYHDPNNWDVFNNWMLKKSPYKKALKLHSADELEILIRQFKSIRSKFDKKVNIPGTKEWYRKTGTTQN